MQETIVKIKEILDEMNGIIDEDNIVNELLNKLRKMKDDLESECNIIHNSDGKYAKIIKLLNTIENK